MSMLSSTPLTFDAAHCPISWHRLPGVWIQNHRLEACATAQPQMSTRVDALPFEYIIYVGDFLKHRFKE
ncbi:hypothetical protein Poly41_56870 [Novipirellula artificiosorum]|uniref:Uncharacterized protein n=1 Tax=Novipirellula artificiosorum TaxID=2528016 RepID=A0A5C6D5G9_9BACT|nr:hypothetical protein Poly41_56870 [Novipirellula artificiosorum]